MNRLTHLIQALVHGDLRPIDGALAHVDGVRQNIASLADSICIGALLDVDASGFQEAF